MENREAAVEQISTSLRPLLGEEIEDADEEIFFLFSDPNSSNGLGFIDPKSAEITVDVNGRELEILQSPGILNSVRKGGTTGAVLWKVTPTIARWLANRSTILWTSGILHSQASIVELGCGTAGLLGICLAPLVGSYLLTDQEYVMKLVRENVASNPNVISKKGACGRRSARENHVRSPNHMVLDWETDSASNIEKMLGNGNAVDLLIACDCVYNNFLIQPFVAMCVDICKTSREGQGTVILVAQQLRAEDVLSEWLEKTMDFFHVWRVPDIHLPTDLKSGSGYAVHLAILKAHGV